MEYNQNITCRFGGSVPLERLTAVQGDNKTRFIRVSLVDGDQPYAIPANTTAEVRLKKPDKTVVHNPCTISSGVIVIELTAQMLAAYGRAKCSVTLRGSDTSELTTVYFYLDILEAAVQDGDIESSDEFKLLAETLTKISSADTTATSALTKANQAVTTANTANTTASTANTTANAAKTAATTASTTAGSALATANTAQTNADNALAKSSEALSTANNAKATAGTATDAASNALTLATQAVDNVAKVEAAKDAAVAAAADANNATMDATAAATAANTAADRANAAVEDMKNTYALSITGEASGAVVALDDIAGSSDLRRAAIQGTTTQSGTPSPAAPVDVAGLVPAALYVAGGNILNQAANTVLGVYPYQTGTVLAAANGANSVYAKITPGKTYAVFKSRVTARFTVAFTVDPPLAAGVATYSRKSNESGTRIVATAPANCNYITVYHWNAGHDGQTAPEVRIAPEDHTHALPALAPLYGREGVVDTFDVVSGLETRRWGIKAFTGMDRFFGSGGGTTDTDAYIYVFTSLPSAGVSNGLELCTHFQKGNPTGAAGDSFSQHATDPTSFYFRVYASSIGSQKTAIDDVDFVEWIEAQNVAGTPVTVVYRLADPVTVQHDGQTITPPSPSATIYADTGAVDVGYVVDTKAYIDKAIAAALG